MTFTRLTIADLFRTNSIQAIRLSPGGSAGAITVRSANVEKQRNDSTLWLWRADDDSVTRITQGPEDASAQWIDEMTVLFSSRKREEDEEKADKPFSKTRLYTISTRGGEPVLRATLDGIVWDMDVSPDGRTLALSYSPNPRVNRNQSAVWEKAPRPTIPSRMRWKLDGFGLLPDALPQIHVLPLRGETWKKPRLVVEDPARSLTGVRWVPGSERLVYFSTDNDSKFSESHLMLSDLKGRAHRLEAPAAEVTALAPSPDGRSVAICCNDDVKRGGYLPVHLVVRTIDPKDRAWRTVLETDGNLGEQRTLSDLLPVDGGHLRWQDERTVLALHSISGETHLLRVDIESGRFDVLAGAGGVVHAFDVAGSTILHARADPGNPGEVFRLGRRRPLTRFNAAVARRYDVRPVRWRTVSERGVAVDTWLWATRKQLESARKHSLPLILYVHGGPMVQAGQSPFHEYTWLAQNGYAVVTGNPRGSSGYGGKHGAAIYADWGNKDMKDLLAVRAETLRRHPQFDPGRTFIMGGSYGGYTTNWMITHKPGLFRAAVTDRCVFNSLSFAGTSDFSNAFPPSEMGLSNIWEDPMKAWERSPASLLPKVTEPLLIIHSDNDWRCPISQAEELFTGLVELGKRIGEDVRLVMFKGESHGLSRGGRPENRRIRLEEILSWVRKHDKPRA